MKSNRVVTNKGGLCSHTYTTNVRGSSSIVLVHTRCTSGRSDSVNIGLPIETSRKHLHSRLLLDLTIKMIASRYFSLLLAYYLVGTLRTAHGIALHTSTFWAEITIRPYCATKHPFLHLHSFSTLPHQVLTPFLIKLGPST